MAENVGGSDIFGSGGHAWLWGEKAVAAKTLGSVGVSGVARFVIGTGARPLQIVGKRGPALLKASDSSKVDADTALNALIDAIEALKNAGTTCAWEDDHGRTGDALQITQLRLAGPRQYGRTGGNWQAWQFYTCSGVELLGAF